MNDLKDQDKIDELRQRLYQRGTPIDTMPTHALTKNEPTAPTAWEHPPEPLPEPEPEPAPEPESATLEAMPRKKKRRYRMKLVVAGVLFFVLSAMVSSLLLIGGGNTISGENITLEVDGPFTIGGGEAIPLQVGVSNQNTVPIESATLIVEYPQGTRSVSDTSKEVFIERLALDTIESGESRSVPLRAVVFGEEDEEQTINVSIEYRVRGSNALFFKEADPLRYKIGSSPIRLSVDSVRKISSGQETDITLTVTSNAQTTLSDLLIKAFYPGGFDFTSSAPSPTYAQNMWQIPELEPGESTTVTITGVVVGTEAAEYAMDFAVGVPNENDIQNLASVFTTEQISFEVERPFVAINMKVNGQTDEEIIATPGETITTLIDIENTLGDTIYDGRVEVQLSGNALADVSIDPRNGFFNSSNNTASWDIGSHPELEEITPGESVRVSLSIKPAEGVSRTPQVGIAVDVTARRITESNVSESLRGGATAVVRLVSEPTLAAEIGYHNNVFNDIGSIPPEAEKATTYSISLIAENGSNDITEGIVTTSLPPYVTWLDNTAGAGSFFYNDNNRQLSWNIGSVDANATVLGSFQISFLPSATQIGQTPVLMSEPRLRADDRFTGAVVRATGNALTTQLPERPDSDGRVSQ